MSTTYRGTDLQKISRKTNWDPTKGGQTIDSYTGTEAAIQAKAAELQLAGWATEIETGAPYRLTATYSIDLITNPGGDNGGPSEPTPVPQWELIPHDVEQDLLETNRQWVFQLPADVKSSIEAKIKNPQNKSLFVVPTQYTSPQIIDNAFRVFILKQSGIESRLVTVDTLKRTITVSSNYSITWSKENNGKVLSTAKVVGLYNVPTSIQGLLTPSYGEYENVPINSSQNTNRFVTIPWYYGWLEKGVSVQNVGASKVQISQEWIWGKYPVGTSGVYDLIS